MKTKAIALSLLILCAHVGLLAQEKPELFARIERVFREQEPAWKVERINLRDTVNPHQQEIVFRSARGQALVDVMVWEKEKDAGDVFTAHSASYDDTAGKKKVKRSLPNLGDENHIWTHPGSTAWPTIKFRKGSIIVTIFAPSVAVAKRFARHVHSQIAAPAPPV